jgi:hypothetical protein
MLPAMLDEAAQPEHRRNVIIRPHDAKPAMAGGVWARTAANNFRRQII